MRSYVVLALLVCSLTSSLAQPYVTPRFTTASELNIPYGIATAFNTRVDTLRLNVFYPVDDGAASRPLAIWVHGGGFTGGNLNEMNALCERWAQRGYVAATIQYRLGFYGPWPFEPPFAFDTSEVLRACYRGIQDHRGAIGYLVANASRYKIDTARIVTGGVSAGAIIALHTAFIDASDTPPPSIGAIDPVTRAFDVFPRPDLGPLVTTGEPLPTIRAVVNIFGALTDLRILNGRAFVPTYSYHQRGDPVVPCSIAKGLWGLPFDVSANYPKLYGSCSFTNEIVLRGIPADKFESWIYEGADHAPHNERAVDSAAAVFCARMINSSVSVEEDVEIDPNAGPWLIMNVRGSVVGQVLQLDRSMPLPDGVYCAVSGQQRTMILMLDGTVRR